MRNSELLFILNFSELYIIALIRDGKPVPYIIIPFYVTNSQIKIIPNSEFIIPNSSHDLYPLHIHILRARH